MRLREAIVEIVSSSFPKLFYRGVFEFRVISADGDRYELDPVTEKWLPPIKLCDLWPGLGGVSVAPKAGTIVAVAFLNADPSKPIVVAFPSREKQDVPDSVAIDADEINLGTALGTVIRDGDTVAITGTTPSAGVITVTLGLGSPTPAKSKVKA